MVLTTDWCAKPFAQPLAKPFAKPTAKPFATPFTPLAGGGCSTSRGDIFAKGFARRLCEKALRKALRTAS